MIDIEEIKNLSLDEKIGQMFIIAIDEPQITNKTKEMIKKYKIGGFILYKKNYKNYQEMIDVINTLKEINRENRIPLFISIDQEGGRVNRMPEEFLNIPNAEKLAKGKDIRILKKSGTIIGKMLKQTGINMNFAPVMDIGSKYNKKLLGNRTYSENLDEVSKFSTAVVKGMQSEKVIPVIKHFPGHGATKIDSHYILPIITKEIKKLEEEDIQPFKRAIENGVDCIMIGHLIVYKVDKKYPASLSSKIILYLRKKLRYSGVIITDDLKMKAISIFYGKIKSMVLAIKAGNDIVLTKNKYSKIIKAIEKINKKIEKGKITEARINRSVKRILILKEKYDITDENIKGANIEEINKEIKDIIFEIND